MDLENTIGQLIPELNAWLYRMDRARDRYEEKYNPIDGDITPRARRRIEDLEDKIRILETIIEAHHQAECDEMVFGAR